VVEDEGNEVSVVRVEEFEDEDRLEVELGMTRVEVSELVPKLPRDCKGPEELKEASWEVSAGAERKKRKERKKPKKQKSAGRILGKDNNEENEPETEDKVRAFELGKTKAVGLVAVRP
jgi:hypothetical protein